MTENLRDRLIMIIAEEYDARPSLARDILSKSDELARRIIEIDKLPDDAKKDITIDIRPVSTNMKDHIRHDVIGGKHIFTHHNFTNDTQLNDILGLNDYNNNTFVYNHKDGEDKEVSLNKCENCSLKKSSIHKNIELKCLFDYIKKNPPIAVYSIKSARYAIPLGVFSYSESKWVRDIVNFLWEKTITKRLPHAVHVIKGVNDCNIVIETNDIDKEMRIGIGLIH